MQMRVKVRLEHYDRHGRLKKVVCKDSDRVLDNFGYLLRLIFYPVPKLSGYRLGDFVAEDGYTYKLSVGYSDECWDYCYNSERRYYCEIGTGTTAPSNSDYKLESFHNRAVADIYSLELLSDVIRITLRASVQATANVTINEVGLSLYSWCYEPTARTTQARYFLLFRDVLSEGISMLSGEYLAVYYTIEFTR